MQHLNPNFRIFNSNQKLMKYILILSCCLSSLLSLGQLKQVTANNATFNYIDTGKGQPIVFIHGALEDYTSWLPQLERFSKQYRVIAYSRRYNFPNNNG